MQIATNKAGPVTVVALTGELDGRSGGGAQEHILGLLAPGGHVLIDLTGVTFVSGAGVRTMLLIYRQAQCVSCQVGLVGLSPELRSVLQATGFLGFFLIADTIDDGVDALCVGLPDVSATPERSLG
jgi:anti-sigma B factor antagonist